VTAPSVEDLAAWANGRARELVLQDGTHDTTVVLRLPDGSLQTQIVGGDGGSLADAVEAIADEADVVGADAVVVVAEAWSAANPEREPREVLLVAGLDRAGDLVVFETPLERRPTHREVGETLRTDTPTVLLDGVRRRWGLDAAR
jgi:hypothetical protein